jgi:hypothetical protein
MKKARIGALLILAAAAGCYTPYQRMGFRGGYDEYPLDADTYVVSAQGNGYTSSERVGMYVHYRCAELAVETGHDFFGLLASENLDSTGQFTTQGHSSTSTTGHVSVYGNTAYGTARSHTTYTPGQTMTFVKPGRSATIRLISGERPEGAFDAREVMQLLGPRIGVPRPGGRRGTEEVEPPNTNCDGTAGTDSGPCDAATD